MSKKLSQKEAKERSLNFGVIMIGKYIDAHTKILFECLYCQRQWLTQQSNIWKKKISKCGHCNNPKIGDKFGRLTITTIFPAKAYGCKVKALCQCGKTWTGYFRSIKNGNIQSCGCAIIGCNKISQKEAEKKSLNVGIKLVDKYIDANTKVRFQCPNCSNIWECKPCNIWNRRIRSCGYCHLPKINDINGRLTITKIIPSATNGCSVETKCVCGKKQTMCYAWFKKVKSCGYCENRCRGQKTSHLQLDLHKLLEHKGVHNYKFYYNTKQYFCIDIAYVLNGCKIAIEYDELYWHKNRTDKDRKRLQILRQHGWKTLQIRAHGDLPSTKQLYKAINKLAYTKSKKITITLSSWKKGIK